MKNKSLIWIIVGAVILIILVIAGAFYFLSNKPQRPGPGGNFQLTQAQTDDVNNFFSSNPPADQINTYCAQNRMNCFYYCRNNPSAVACQTIMNFTRGNFTRSGNFTRGNFTRRNMTPPMPPTPQ